MKGYCDAEGSRVGLTMNHFEEARKLVENMQPTPLFGYKMMESEFMGEAVWRFRWRTWKERLFSLPWRPMKKMAFYQIYKPTGDFIVDTKNGVIVGHPTDIAKLRTHLIRLENDIIPDNDSASYRRDTGEPRA